MIGLLCWPPCRLFIRSCISAMDIRSAAQTAPTTVGGEDLVLVPLQVSGSLPKGPRLNVKVSVPSVRPPPPPPVPAIIPSVDLHPPLWQGITEASFEEACHQRKYRVVYNRFQAWFFAVIQFGSNYHFAIVRRRFGTWLGRTTAVSVNNRRI